MTASQPMQGNSTSSVLGRRLGAELVKLRTAAGLTQTHAAKALTASTTKVAKMERGWVPMRDPDLRALCELYEVRDLRVIRGLLDLARIDRERRKAKGWWDDYATLGDMQEYVSLENAATAIKAWQPSFIPGLLQTPDYVRASRKAQTAGDPAEDEEFVAARLTRQQRLVDDSPLTLRAVIYESALRNLPADAATARGQIDHLAKVAEQPNVTLLIHPFSTGPQVGLNGSFNVMSFAEPGAMDVVYLELPLSRLWIEGGEDTAAYNELFEAIAARSLSKDESVSHLHHLRKEL
ncbi:helix-turn-helix domain-containing protein [Streptomyces poonensis]|uniref:Transcriptional regulator n=1 Tax=Streptomyces poonensis TaxID=68255 RepID=A0A918PKL4_9ACTN|nr:helix-turn-helix transcriptional regulator [Streptomyces poonensis]GGZ11914.1 transcriptional regulator [Streptomyces poonensis]